MRAEKRYNAALLLLPCVAVSLAFLIFSTFFCNETSNLIVSTLIKPPMIVVVTPTYRRQTRFADFTRLANTLAHIRHLHWIVIEDNTHLSHGVERILDRTQLPYTYIASKTVDGYPKKGWWQRTVALRYLRANTSEVLGSHREGVLYFADDDNSYDVTLFTNYIRNVKKLGMWAVGLAGGSAIESQIVENGTFAGFQVRWRKTRKFAIDMAGFAVNLRVILNSTAEFGTSCKRGGNAPEPCFLEDLQLKRSDIEVFGYEKKKDREILVWHTRTVGRKFNRTQHYDDLNGFNFEF